jgi:voltage-gated potassium channel
MSWKRWVGHALILSLILVVYFAAPVRLALDESTAVRLSTVLVALGLLAAFVVWVLRRQVDDESRRIDGLITVILVVVVAFSLAFYIMEKSSPGEVAGLKTRLDSLYFTVSTLLTIGYGDVHAQGQAARALVLVQVVFNTVFVATAAGLLSARVRTRARQRSDQRTEARSAQQKPG